MMESMHTSKSRHVAPGGGTVTLACACGWGWWMPASSDQVQPLLQLNSMPLGPNPQPAPQRTPQKWPLGSWDQLHRAAHKGSVEGMLALLSSGSVDIDQGTPPDGWTPLMIAAVSDHSRIVEILLNKGAKVSTADIGGFNALHLAAERGHLGVVNLLVAAGSNLEATTSDDGDGNIGFTALHAAAEGGRLGVVNLLVEAGSNLEAATSDDGSTPLHLAAEEGQLGVVSVLIEAGANPNSRRFNGATPLYCAARYGRMDAVKVLLGAKADPLLTFVAASSGFHFVPLDAAAQHGHSEFIRELIQQVGIAGCGGNSGGVDALEQAALQRQVEVMASLTDSGVVDTGQALITAAKYGGEASVKLLLQQEKGNTMDLYVYVNARCCLGNTPLSSGIAGVSPRIVRLLVDAGADTASAVRTTDGGGVVFNGTPLALATRYLSKKKIEEEEATEDQLHRLEAIRRLLLRVKAVHVVSWVWPRGIPSKTPVALGGARGTTMTSAPLTLMLPALRRRARRPRVLLAALVRNSEKR